MSLIFLTLVVAALSSFMFECCINDATHNTQHIQAGYIVVQPFKTYTRTMPHGFGVPAIIRLTSGIDLIVGRWMCP